MDRPLQIGGLVFPDLDQLDFTGPFEVLARLPHAAMHLIWKDKTIVRDQRSLLLAADTTFAEAPQLDVLIVPGGKGQQSLMEDDDVLSFLRRQAAGAQCVLSVCTGALICGAAGLLKGRRATTHWSVLHLLPYFGATAINARFVEDGQFVFAAGVTSGLDGALCVAAKLCGERVAKEIQLALEYAPEPPFKGGTLATASDDIVDAVRSGTASLAEARLATARRIAAQLGIPSC
jgi:cyclohexyl-isocyanide hydratase